MTINRQDKVVKSVVGYGFPCIHPLTHPLKAADRIRDLHLREGSGVWGRGEPPPEAGNHFICELRHTQALIHILLMLFSSSFHTPVVEGVSGEKVRSSRVGGNRNIIAWGNSFPLQLMLLFGSYFRQVGVIGKARLSLHRVTSSPQLIHGKLRTNLIDIFF